MSSRKKLIKNEWNLTSWIIMKQLGGQKIVNREMKLIKLPMSHWINVRKRPSRVTRMKRRTKKQLMRRELSHAWQKFIRIRYRSLHEIALVTHGPHPHHPPLNRQAPPKTQPPSPHNEKEKTNNSSEDTPTRHSIGERLDEDPVRANVRTKELDDNVC